MPNILHIESNMDRLGELGDFFATDGKIACDRAMSHSCDIVGVRIDRGGAKRPAALDHAGLGGTRLTGAGESAGMEK